MCGLGGFAGVKDATARQNLVWALGMGIDERGGDAAGFVTVGQEIRQFKKLGWWISAKKKFLARASDSPITMMHSRFATCGKKTIDEVHPFAIKRDGKVKLYGAHNGMIYNAEESSKKHGRHAAYSVDSKELFELLADGKMEEIRELNGYGVITWVEAGENRIKLARLSSNSDIHVVSLVQGGVVWGSTRKIVDSALEVAGLTVKTCFNVDEVGRVFHMDEHGVWISDTEGVKVSSGFSRYGGGTNWYHYRGKDTYDNHSSSSSLVYDPKSGRLVDKESLDVRTKDDWDKLLEDEEDEKDYELATWDRWEKEAAAERDAKRRTAIATKGVTNLLRKGMGEEEKEYRAQTGENGIHGSTFKKWVERAETSKAKDVEDKPRTNYHSVKPDDPLCECRNPDCTIFPFNHHMIPCIPAKDRDTLKIECADLVEDEEPELEDCRAKMLFDM